MKDILGKALHDFYMFDVAEPLWIVDRNGEKEEMPVGLYFRTVADMPAIEQRALDECEGRILEIGAGAGSHTLLLQQRDHDVTALDISPLACKVMESRGVQNIVCANVYEYTNKVFDTVLLLMNGIGLTSDIRGLETFLSHAKNVVSDRGKLLFDSSDVAYLFDEDEIPLDHYYGEVEYQYLYKNDRTEWLKWLYIDPKTLARVASNCGWTTNIIMAEENEHYLAELTQTNSTKG